MSDNPCVKPDLTPISDTPLFESCTIPNPPPPLTDCADIDVPVPTMNVLAAAAGGGASGVLPVIVLSNDGGCSCTVQGVTISGGVPTPFGDPFSAVAISIPCCELVLPGMYGWSFQDQTSGEWALITASQDGMVAFVLTADMSAGSATATIWVLTGGVYVDTGVEITVYDPLNQFQCSREGMAGFAECSYATDAAPQFQILACQSVAHWIKFKLLSTLSVGDASVSAQVLEAHFGDVPAISDTITIRSNLQWSGATNTQGVALLGIDSGVCYYFIWQLDCAPPS